VGEQRGERHGGAASPEQKCRDWLRPSVIALDS
jgi:hypothetical protein